MLAIEYKSKAGIWHSFTVNGNIYKFQYKFEKNYIGEDGVKIQTTIPDENYYNNKDAKIVFTIPFMPSQKITAKVIFKQLYYPLNAHLGKLAEGKQPPKPWDGVLKDMKKRRAYAYLRSFKISQVLASYIFRDFLVTNHIDYEVAYDISTAIYRLYPSKKYAFVENCMRMIKIYLKNDKSIMRLIISDLLKYSPATGRYVFRQIILHEGLIGPEWYRELLVNIPPVLKELKYNLEFSCQEEDVFPMAFGHRPTDRFGWYVYKVLQLTGYVGYEDLKNLDLGKGITDGKGAWAYFRKAYHIKGPYSFKKLAHMFNVIHDGQHIYKQSKDNDCGIPFVSIEGSFMRMMRNAIYNHRQDLKLKKAELLKKPNKDMAKPAFPIPQWIENIRIKTHHDMIIAGQECQHCIGSYIWNDDIFVREGNLCAQIESLSLKIIQCYDVHDTITKESESFKRRLEKALAKQKEINQKSESRELVAV